MKYSDSLISDILAANDITEYVSKYVQLTKRGKDYIGLCPFHNEKTPSFHVSADKQLFHCFGCGAGGNIIQFIMQSENLDFVDAIKLMAERAGIALPEEDNTYDDKKHKQKERILEMNKLAARFFHSMLTDQNIGTLALEYFKKRGITQKTITAYGLGFAPNGFDALLNHLKANGFTEEEIISASLAVSRDGKVYDKFRNRVMFPIIDVRGNIIGFGGRIFEEVPADSSFKPPKYLNSGETIAFDKGRNLFSLNLAKKSSSKQLILVEGYMDVISVYQAGIPNIIATLGTALTENQAKLMLRYASEVLICYDMDEAGRAAVKRAIEIFRKIGGKTRVVKLKDAKDPDEYIKKNGSAMFKKALDSAIPSTEFLLSQIKLEHNINETEGKIAFVSEAAKSLAELGDTIEIDAYINKISAETGIGKEAIYTELKKNSYYNSKKNSTIKAPILKAISNSGVKSNPQSNAVFDAQRKLLNLISQDKHVYKAVKDIITPSDYTDEVFQTIAEKIYESLENNIIPEQAVIMNLFSDNQSAMGIASGVFYELSEYGNKHETVQELVQNILLYKIDQEKALAGDDFAKLGELVNEQNKIKNLQLTWD